MKLNAYINETMKMPPLKTSDEAFWISPNGEALIVKTTHISEVIASPKKFGYTREEIDQIYKDYDEPIGVEGKARNQIIIELVEGGWIRIRQYPRVGWSINVGRMSKRTKDILYDWANAVINSSRRIDKYEFVNITGFVDGYKKTMTLKDLAEKKLYESDEVFYKENSIVVVKSAMEFTWKKDEGTGQSTTTSNM